MLSIHQLSTKSVASKTAGGKSTKPPAGKTKKALKDAPVVIQVAATSKGWCFYSSFKYFIDFNNMLALLVTNPRIPLKALSPASVEDLLTSDVCISDVG